MKQLHTTRKRHVTQLYEARRDAGGDEGKVAWRTWLDISKGGPATCAFLVPHADNLGVLTPEEWQLANDRYDGCELRCLEQYRDRRFGNNNTEIDGFGRNLSAARTLSGNHHVIHHDTVADTIAAILSETGSRAVREPSRLFAREVDPAVYPHIYNSETPRRNRIRGITPDIEYRSGAAATKVYAEVKVMNFCKTRYTGQPLTSTARAVDIRADMIRGEYDRAARQLDDQVAPGWNTGPTATGPVQRRLAALGPIKRFVVGAFGELSKDLEVALKAAAQQGAARLYRRMGVSSPGIAEPLLLARMRRRIALAGIKHAANTIIDRIPMIAAGGAGVAARARQRTARGLFGGNGNPMEMSRLARATRVITIGHARWDAD